jgi:hypothetical protein
VVKPQSADVLRLLRLNPQGISQQDAIDAIRCYRLAARISDLKAEGYEIRTILVGSNGHRWAKYVLVENAQLMLGVA